MSNNLNMDGRELFMKLAEKIMRGELVVTHFVANMMPSMDRRYDVRMGLEGFAAESPRVKIDVKATVVENDLGQAPAPAPIVSIPIQVREVIFDELERPIYDSDLADGE